MHILLVEDNEATARSVELILATAGHNVSRTASGEDAVALAELYDYDGILMDLELEDITGLEALRSLRAKRMQVPVIVLSGSVDMESKVSALAAGADDYMTKPFHKAELVARINAVVRRSRGQAELDHPHRRHRAEPQHAQRRGVGDPDPPDPQRVQDAGAALAAEELGADQGGLPQPPLQRSVRA